MIVFFIAHGLTLLATLVLGLAVFLANPRRTTNSVFLLLSLFIAGWLACLTLGIHTTEAGWARRCIQAATLCSVILPQVVNWLRVSIKYPQKSPLAVVLHAPAWLALAAVTAAVCCTPLYIRQIILPESVAGLQLAPMPDYGVGVYLFALYFSLSFLVLLVLFIRDVRRLQGLARTEMQFILLGCALGLLYGFSTCLLLPFFFHMPQAVRFAPFGAILLNGVIAYGIATQRVLEVALFLRRLLAYTLLIVYLVGLYLLVWWLSEFVWEQFHLPGAEIPHVLAAVVIAFSMTPTHGVFQRFANRLFLNWGGSNVAQTSQKAGALLRSVTTIDELLRRFHRIVAEALGTDEITILVPEAGHFVQTVPAVASAMPLALGGDTLLVRELETRSTPLVLDAALRGRATAQLQAAMIQLQQAHASVALGIKGSSGLCVILLLGPRLSGRIYSAVEQDTLQLLASQFAAALENARLYTQVQDGKIYNDLLLDHLINGVIAVNAEGHVNIFNREAQRVTGLTQEAVLGQPFMRLPAPLAATLREIWGENRRVLNRELVLKRDRNEISLRAGGAIFTGHAGARLGALLVFSDITDIKRLELQIRRSDRLASIGTLSAGMAHEIKNPLTALKTFAQLLPERYEDAEFRTTFSKLAQTEIERIDGIVNQLLEFSRPAKPLLAQASLRQLIQRPLKLISEAAYKKRIFIETHFNAADDTLLADLNLLPQALLNFLLNALDALGDGGRLTLSTSLVEGRYDPAAPADAPPRPYFKLDISDSGCGMTPETLLRIFDPFFTTKSSGTGLGLTVAHGILHEHGGSIEVESRVGEGTTFHLFFPRPSGSAA